MAAVSELGIGEVSQRYAQQFREAGEKLRQRTIELQGEIQNGQTPVQLALLNARQALQDPAAQQEFIANATDLGPVPPTTGSGESTFRFILETYSWTSICLLSASIGAILGGYIFTPILSLGLTTIATTLLAYLVLPLYAHYLNKNKAGDTSETDVRMHLLGISFAIGMLNGHNLSTTYMYTIAPPAFLLPATIAVMADVVGPKVADNRPLFIAACVGPAAALYILIGLVTGSLSLGYFIFTLAACAVAGAGLQFTIAAVRSNAADKVETQIVQIMTAIVAGAVMTLILGTTKERYQEFKSSQYAAQ